MNRIDRRSDLLVQLSDGIAALTDSDRWRRHLDFQSRFHHYSFGNIVLVASQFPGATRVAGFRAWQKLGRTVCRGETAIWILAPMTTRRKAEADEGEDRPVSGFRCVPVFDVSQTEGADLPAVCAKLDGDDRVNAFARLTAAAGVIGYSVELTSLDNEVNGDCTFELRRIRVEAGNSSAQQVKTLAHELGHAVLHHEHEHHGSDRRPLAELEAESTAYVVCRHLGMDSGAYSFGYVATWAGGGEEAVAGIRSSGGRIQLAAKAILDLLGEEGPVSATEAA